MSALVVRQPTAWRPWVRDFTLVGAVTGFAAPYLVIHALPYSALTGLGGALAGAVLGRASASLLSGRMRRWPKAAFIPLGLLVGGLWGAASGAASWLESRDLGWLAISALVAGLAGSLQLGWFWLAYSYRRVNHRSTWPLVGLACLLGSGLGWGALLVLDLLRHLPG